MKLLIMLIGYCLIALYLFGVMGACLYLIYVLVQLYSGKYIPSEYRYYTLSVINILFMLLIQEGMKLYFFIHTVLDYYSLF